ncbi:MAG: phosphate/phosphite/phosphonate ABC transporter substrate-binding protein, partial [Rhodospirillales bacterium]|nr:phosphate/phosphite/phosphonate ABC transporter substrate-binding protein [Rhodospirillales bacterium]
VAVRQPYFADLACWPFLHVPAASSIFAIQDMAKEGGDAPMGTKLNLTFASGDYEIVSSLKDGTVTADGIELTMLTDMDSSSRHWRMLRGMEFDVAELSASSYLMAKDRGLPLTAIPVFPHRRFRHGFIFVNTHAGITSPKDLQGKRVGIKTWQATAVLYLRGLLAGEYGVDLSTLQWRTEQEEELPFEAPAGYSITRVPEGRHVGDMLAEGELDAALYPEILDPILRGDARVGRLFADYRAEEEAYFKRTRNFPIMHVTVVRDDILQRHPWVASNLAQACERAKLAAYRRLANPRRVPLAWFLDEWDRQRELMGPDPWENGLTPANRRNLETLIGFSHSQGLISQAHPVEFFFTEAMLEPRSRGEWLPG